MKKYYQIVICCALFLCAFFNSNAQINYTFTAVAGTYTANATPTVLIGANQDFGISAATAIGFTFNFGGTNYTQFRATSDGYLTFNTATTWTSGWNDLTGNTNDRPMLAPLWDDLSTSNTGNVNYRLTGASPNRILTVEWTNMLWYWGSVNPSIHFQVKLYETTNVVEFVYQRIGTANGNVNSPSASIGIGGQCTGDFYSLNNTSTAPVASKTLETTTIGTPKPVSGQIYRWTPTASAVTNDLCANAIAIPYSLGSCVATSGSVVGTTATGSPAAPACWSPATTSHDVWYTVTKPAGQTGMTVSLDNVSSVCNPFGTAFSVYSGGCGGLTLVGCADNGGTLNPNNAVLNLSGLPAGATTYWIRVEGDGTTTGSFQICVRDPLCPSSLGAGVVNVAALPYSVAGQTTCGMVDNLTNANTTVCSSTWFYSAEDAVYVFTPTASGNITISSTSSSWALGLHLYNGCPLAGGGGTCVGSSEDYTGNGNLCAPVTAGTTYYLVVDEDNWGGCITNYSLSISAPSGIPAGTTCANPLAIAALPYSAVAQTTACFGNDYTNASTGSCGSWYESGEDKVYSYVATGPECIGITLSNASTFSIGFQVYSGCPGTAGTTCVGSYGGNNPLTGSVTLPGAGTYYIIVDTWSAPANASYDIAITSFGSGPVNDLPCNATALTLGTSAAGDNTCSGGGGEPAIPTCWWAGNVNTVWYSVVCPASGQLRIMTTLGSLYDSQIQVYSGTCSALTAVAAGCNDNATICTSGINLYSLLDLTGLTPGATYFIQLDGYGNYTGSFSITASDGSIPPPPTVQDCSGAIPVCGPVSITQTVSYFGCGSTNNIPASCSAGNPCTNPNPPNSGCLNAGERNSLWYQISVSANGVLAWTINNPAGSIYDWTLYPTTANTCTDIANGLVVPVRCNWNSGSNTVGTGMQNPIPVGGIAANFEQPLNVTAGQSYVLCVTNYSGTSGGTTIDFANSTCGFAAPSSVTWVGSTNTVWGTAANWGGCNPPSCSIDAVVSPSTNQPVVSVNSTVKNLTVLSGASLTINPGITLTICGNFINYGTLNISPTATILFNNGAVTHNITGSFTGTNKLGNLTITKTGGSVIANNAIDIGGNFTTSNATSVFNSNGAYIRVAGNFLNASGTATYTGITTLSTLEFNGSGAQNYNPTVSGGTNLTLNNIVLNNTNAGYTDVTLLNNMIAGTSGIITLTNGTAVTNAFEVQLLNTANAAITTGNTNSFVAGNLRRYLAASATGAFDFPVGHTAQGYQRAKVDFTTAAAAGALQLLARFDTWGGAWPQPGAPGWGPECGASYNMPYLNNGLWSITSSVASTGNYDITLYNTNYTNSAAGWSVAKSPSASPAWALQGSCVPSPVSAVIRSGLSGFSRFATIQSNTLLILPIELVSFTGTSNTDYNFLEWQTISEQNSHSFELQSSTDGYVFSPIATKSAAGNSNALITYNYKDYSFYSPVTFYRLKMIDTDGSFAYSATVTVENKNNQDFLFSEVFPNPAEEKITVKLNLPRAGNVKTEITDMAGRVLFSQTIESKEGAQLVDLDITNLSTGSYFVRVAFGRQPVQVKRFMKQ